ncbi:hypothetical protein GMLC_08820 [Geomonas limicola]|uniref:Dockerin domain-containing protein n=1 Tax=Geomonas limicola TaxID=2740186 RepID=A0A6V8N6X5_9BACT|nr:Ig-like domain-containing protein [Geomonas limicola]GFO67303.1 hypothetical protein GMLC_08820 [Geomonas limicola]
MRLRNNFSLRLPWAALLALALWFAGAAPAQAAITYNNWSSSGPTPAPSKAVVKTLAVAPTTPLATVYNGTDGGGVYTMNEGGTGWTAANAGLKNRQIQGFAVHPVDPKVVYAATRDGLFKTSDGAASWVDASSGLTTTNVRFVAIDPLTPTTLYAAGPAGVFKSSDGAGSWSQVNTGLTSQNVRWLLIDPVSTSIVYAATDAGIFQTTDSGAHWGAVNTGLNNQDVLCLAYGATGSSPTIFAGTNGGGVFISSDAGATWAADNGSLGNLIVNIILVDNPAAPGTAYAGTGNGLYKQSYASSSWGAWSSVTSGISVPAVLHALANNPTARATLYAGTDLGAFRSTASGSSWTALGTGLRPGSSLAIKPSDNTIIVGGMANGGIYRSSDSASTWIAVTSANPGTPTAFLFDPTGTPVYAASGNGVYKSVDDGVTWTSLSANLPNTDVRALCLGAGGALHAATSEGIYVYNSGTDTWSAYAGGQPSNTDLTGLAFRGVSLFTATNGGGVYRSDNGGSWSQINTNLTSTVVNALVLDAGNIYVGTPSGVFRSADNGATWFQVSSGITNTNVKALGLAMGNPSFLTAGTNGGGVFFSTNSGDVWTAMNTGLTDKTVTSLAASSAAKKVYAGTAGSKIFGLKLSPVSAISPSAPSASSPVDFGIVNVNDTKIQVFNLLNTGTLQLNVSAMSLAGTDAGLYHVVAGGSRQCNLPTPVIEAGDYCTIGVNFIPTTTGTKTASLVIASDAPNQPVTSYLQGKGGFPPVASIVTPTTGSTVRNPLAISGTAIDKNQITGADGTGSNLTKVEISTDGGATWNLATKNATLNSWTQWSYSWTATPLPLNGPYVVSARATDSNGIVQSVLSTVNLTVDNVPPVTSIAAKPKVLDNSASGTFSFTVDKPGSTSQCTLDGLTLSCVSPFSYSGLADGSHNFSVLSTDPVGNLETSAKSYGWTIDTAPPVTSISSTPSFYTTASDANFAFSSSEANSAFSCTIDGVSAPCTSPRSYTNLADGSHVFKVQATDPAGNTATTAPTTQTYTWIVDKNNKPSSTITAPGAPLTGTSFNFAGTATDAISGVGTVNIAINGGSYRAAADAAVNPALPWSSWSYLWSLPVNGSYTIQAQAVDNAGNLQANPSTASIIVANPLPDVQLVSPLNAALVGSSSPRVITGTAQAAPGGLALQKVQVAVFSATNPPTTLTWSDASGTTAWSYNWLLPTDGAYTIQARVLDVAPALDGSIVGNVSQVVSRNVTIDTVPPVSTITPLANPYLMGHLATLRGTADDPAPATGLQQVTVTLTDRLGAVASSGLANYNSLTKSWIYTSGTLADGTYTVQSVATDNAGNTQAIASTSSVTIDNVPPVTSITAQPPVLSNLPLSSFTFSANEPSTFICSLDGVAAPCSACGSVPVATCTQSYSGLGNGAHVFTVQATDAAGNQELAAKSAGWTIDLIPPTVTATSPVDGTKRLSVANTRVTVTFSKNVDAATVDASTFYLDHGATAQVSYDAATKTATLTPTGPLAYATTYTATASTAIADFAHNTLGSNYSFSFSTDPDGDVNLDGKVDLTDAMLCLQMAVGLVTPNSDQVRHGDLAPFRTGKPYSDGKLDASDALIILSKVVGLVSW